MRTLSLLLLTGFVMLAPSAFAQIPHSDYAWFNTRIEQALRNLRQIESGKYAVESDRLREGLKDVWVTEENPGVEYTYDLISGRRRIPESYTGAEVTQQTQPDTGVTQTHVSVGTYFEKRVTERWRRISDSAELRKNFESVDCLAVLIGNRHPLIEALRNGINFELMNQTAKVKFGPKH